MTGRTEYLHDSTAGEEKWQKHVVAALWISFALLIALSAGLVYARNHGLFQSLHDQTPPAAPWTPTY
jgi:hypothetical protein